MALFVVSYDLSAKGHTGETGDVIPANSRDWIENSPLGNGLGSIFKIKRQGAATEAVNDS